MPDDLERRLGDVPATFPRPDPDLTERVRRRIGNTRRARRRLGLAAAGAVGVAATLGFTAGHWLIPAQVHAATAVSIDARPDEMTAYIDKVTLYGVAGNRSGETIVIEEKECGSYGGFHNTTGAETGAGGAWSTDAKSYVSPGITTEYRARWSDQVSAPVTVHVHPQVFLQKHSGVFSLWIRAQDIFRGEVAAVQRLSGNRWITMKHVQIKSFKGGYNWGGEAKFRLKVPSGTAVRVVLSQAQVGKCFLPGFSNIVRA